MKPQLDTYLAKKDEVDEKLTQVFTVEETRELSFSEQMAIADSLFEFSMAIRVAAACKQLGVRFTYKFVEELSCSMHTITTLALANAIEEVKESN